MQDKIFSNKNYKYISEKIAEQEKAFSVGIFRGYRYAESMFNVG
jgi:hypothetical protein